MQKLLQIQEIFLGSQLIFLAVKDGAALSGHMVGSALVVLLLADLK